MKMQSTILILLMSAVMLAACSSAKPEPEFDVDSLIPTETTENVPFAAHMGTWYYTPYTDYERKDITKVELVAVGHDQAKITYSDGKTEYIIFNSENLAKRYDYNSDPKVLRSITILYEFKNENGKEHIAITPTYSDTGEVSGQPGPGMYRAMDDFFFDSSVGKDTAASAVGSVGKRDEFKKRTSDLEKYEDESAAKATTQAEINQASYDVYKKWDALLNDIYQYLKGTLPASEFSALQTDEQAWIKKKEAAMEAESADYTGGSMYAMMKNSAGSKYTKERCEYLISLIK